MTACHLEKQFCLFSLEINQQDVTEPASPLTKMYCRGIEVAQKTFFSSTLGEMHLVT